MKRIAILSNAIPDAWLASCGVGIVRQPDYSRYAPVPWRAGVCGHLAYLPALLQDVDGIVLTTSCDQMRRGAEWLNDARRVFLFDTHTAVLEVEKARLVRWVMALQKTLVLENRRVDRLSQQDTNVESNASCLHLSNLCNLRLHGKISVGILGGHFCGDVTRVREFFAQRGIGIRLWGCEGGEYVGDICQRPNDLFYTQLAQLIHARDLNGLVVVRTTWCDLWRAAFARIQEVSAVPVIEWVTDGQPAGQPFPDARSGTRLEALCEVLHSTQSHRETEREKI